MRTGIFQISQEGSAPSLAAHLSWGWYNLGGTRELTSLHVCTAARMKRVKQCEAKADTKVRPRFAKVHQTDQKNTTEHARRRASKNTRRYSARALCTAESQSRSLGNRRFCCVCGADCFLKYNKNPLSIVPPHPRSNTSQIPHLTRGGR